MDFYPTCWIKGIVLITFSDNWVTDIYEKNPLREKTHLTFEKFLSLPSFVSCSAGKHLINWKHLSRFPRYAIGIAMGVNWKKQEQTGAQYSESIEDRMKGKHWTRENNKTIATRITAFM